MDEHLGKAMNQPAVLRETPDFSLVLGGPLYQIFRRAHLSGDALELVHRRILVISLVAWLPLLILSALHGQLLSSIKLPFLHDIETHVRFLIGLPLLIAAELIVHSRIQPAVQNFVKRKMIRPEDMSTFLAAIDSATRLRNSVTTELALAMFAWVGGYWIWHSQIALGSSWYASHVGSRLNLTPAGYWFAFVSLPIFRFILLRWWFRFFIWLRFLWQVSRLSLHLVATYPDRVAGLGFLGRSSYAFAPILFTEGSTLAGVIAYRVLYEGENLMSFKLEAASVVGFFVLLILGPLLLFTPQLAHAKRKGLGQYGLLASQYVEAFHRKWVDNVPPQEELLGTADIQSLADLDNSYAVVREMRVVPFRIREMTALAAVTAAPLLPLGLMLFSFEELVMRLIKSIF